VRKQIADREKFGVERRKSVYVKRQSVESRNNLVAS